MKKVYRSVFWILGDQLNSNHSWFENTDDTRLFVIAELKQEASYCPHHVQKVAAFFASMKSLFSIVQDVVSRPPSKETVYTFSEVMHLKEGHVNYINTILLQKVPLHD